MKKHRFELIVLSNDDNFDVRNWVLDLIWQNLSGKEDAWIARSEVEDEEDMEYV